MERNMLVNVTSLRRKGARKYVRKRLAFHALALEFASCPSSEASKWTLNSLEPFHLSENAWRHAVFLSWSVDILSYQPALNYSF